MPDITPSLTLRDALSPEALAEKFDRNRHLLPNFAETSETELVLPKQSDAEALNRAEGCLLGLAVGEAIGSTIEFLPRGSFDDVTGMGAGGPLQLREGEWTDGTAMALCLAQSLLESETLDQFDFMTRLQAWLLHGENTAQGRTLGVGITTQAAIKRFVQDDDPAAGSEAGESAGNGSLIRLAPLAIFAAKHHKNARFLSSKQSRATHATVECLDACELLTAQLVEALNGANKAVVLRSRIMQLAPNALAINAGEWKSKPHDEIPSSAYVIETLEAALWAVWSTENFHDAVITAANLGGDAAGIAGVAGQLAGALYGCAAIPVQWQAIVSRSQYIKGLASELMQAGAKAF